MSTSVQRLGHATAAELQRHFLQLAPEDLRLRFGTPLAAEAIVAYVNRIDFDVDAVFGVYGDELELGGVAHLAFSDDMAELGVSVLADQRGRGLGGALFARAVEHARNRFVTRLFMHCLTENALIMHLARKAGMAICIDAGEADAFLQLPPANPASVAGEFVDQRLALLDYTLKAHVLTVKRVTAAFRAETP